MKKLCTTCRKYAKSERVLFHYNGHGVPKPTANGEIWLFNKVLLLKQDTLLCILVLYGTFFLFVCWFWQSYTQYIPLPISDLDSWLKTPSIYVFDCSAAGMIVNAFIEVFGIEWYICALDIWKWSCSIQRAYLWKFYTICLQLQDWNASSSSGPARDCILLAACEAHETLPQSAEFPADVFTSCLTTPIKMALRWYLNFSLYSILLSVKCLILFFVFIRFLVFCIFWSSEWSWWWRHFHYL